MAVQPRPDLISLLYLMISKISACSDNRICEIYANIIKALGGYYRLGAFFIYIVMRLDYFMSLSFFQAKTASCPIAIIDRGIDLSNIRLHERKER